MYVRTNIPCLLPAEVDGGWQYHIAVVADPDTNSKVEGKNLWRSYLLRGAVTVVTTGSGSYSVSVTWDKDLVSGEGVCTFLEVFSDCKGLSG